MPAIAAGFVSENVNGKAEEDVQPLVIEGSVRVVVPSMTKD